MAVELENPVELRISGISKKFIDPKGKPVLALKDVTLEIYKNEILVLLGPSGCGKTTLLRCIAGFESIDKGSIELSGEKIDHLAPNKRPVNTVFQSYALFPHMSVSQNIAFGLENENLTKAEIQARVEEMLLLVRMSELADRKPSQMSGGQQQRAALARALAKKPKVLLLDEPLAALDLKLRKIMQVELKRIHNATGTTFIFVTHDQSEAMALGDRIAVFNQGELQQIDTPFNIYNGSKNEFVADFVGESTILEGTLDGNSFDGDGLKIANLNFKSPSNTSTKILIRPENFSLLAHNQSCGFVTITNILFAGDCVDVQANTATGKAIKIKESVKLLSLLQIGDSKELFVAPEYIGQVV